MQQFPRYLSVLCVIVVMCAILLIGATSSQAAPITLTSSAQSLEAEMGTVLSSYMNGGTSSNSTYYSNGQWTANAGTQCWYCFDTAADGAATLGVLQNNASLQQTAIDTFNTAIAQYQLPDGAFENNSGVADQVGTGFFSVSLGMTYLELHSVLPAQTAQTWATSLANAANYLISSGAMTFYINGNVNLRQTEVMWLTYLATGDATYYNWYQTELAFTLDPSQSRWPGYGLQITTQPTDADGSNGAGYLAESNSGTNPGYDPNYTMAQLDTETDLYVLTRNPEFLYLMNLEYNQLVPRINFSNWVLDATGGARDSFMEPFLCAAVSVLVQSGDRPDLAADVAPSDAALISDYQQELTETPNVNYYKGLEATLSLPLLDQEWPQGLDAADTQTPTMVASSSPVTPTPVTTPVTRTPTAISAGTSATATTSASRSGTASASSSKESPATTTPAGAGSISATVKKSGSATKSTSSTGRSSRAKAATRRVVKRRRAQARRVRRSRHVRRAQRTARARRTKRG